MGRRYGKLRERMFAFFNAEGTADFETRELMARFGCADTTVQQYRQEWWGGFDGNAVEVDEVPLLTWAGVMWVLPVKVPRVYRGEIGVEVCDKCGLRGVCWEAGMRGDFVGCERPLKLEL